MTLSELASVICKLEGKKSQMKIGDAREALKLLCAYIAAETIKDGKSIALTALELEVLKNVKKYNEKQAKK